jgi:hypothetical protein
MPTARERADAWCYTGKDSTEWQHRAHDDPVGGGGMYPVCNYREKLIAAIELLERVANTPRFRDSEEVTRWVVQIRHEAQTFLEGDDGKV